MYLSVLEIYIELKFVFVFSVPNIMDFQDFFLSLITGLLTYWVIVLISIYTPDTVEVFHPFNSPSTNISHGDLKDMLHFYFLTLR